MLKKILVGVAVTLGLAVIGAFVADRAGLLD